MRLWELLCDHTSVPPWCNSLYERAHQPTCKLCWVRFPQYLAFWRKVHAMSLDARFLHVSQGLTLYKHWMLVLSKEQFKSENSVSMCSSSGASQNYSNRSLQEAQHPKIMLGFLGLHWLGLHILSCTEPWLLLFFCFSVVCSCFKASPQMFQ